mgnify:CR=1 FL=1
MEQIIEEQSFADGFAVGELTGRLKHQAPSHLKEWVALDKIKDFKSVLRKYCYRITGVSAHQSDSNQVLLTAEKFADGVDSKMILAFANGDRFMDGWEAGCLAGWLRYTQPEAVEEWVKVTNMDAIQTVVDEYGYGIKALQLHPEYKKWIQLTAQRKPTNG